MSSNTAYRSLYSALKGWYCRPLAEYPQDLRTWIECGLGLGIKPQRVQAWWDSKSPAARIAYVKQWDYQHGPAFKTTRDDLERTWDRYEKLERKVSRWENTATPTALHLAEQERNLASLHLQREVMKRELHHIRGDLAPVDVDECVQPEHRSAGDRQLERKGGRPKTIEKKSRVLRQLIEAMTMNQEINPTGLPGNIADLFDACQRAERAKVGKRRVFSGSEGAFRRCLKAAGYGFKGGRPPRDENQYWTRLMVKTLPLINDEVFAEVSDAPPC